MADMDNSRTPLVGNDLPVVYLDLETCFETFPCQHSVTDALGKTRRMLAPCIIQLYKDRGLVPDAHFSDQSIVEPEYEDDTTFEDEEVAALLGQNDDGEDNVSCDFCCGSAN